MLMLTDVCVCVCDDKRVLRRVSIFLRKERGENKYKCIVEEIRGPILSREFYNNF